MGKNYLWAQEQMDAGKYVAREAWGDEKYIKLFPMTTAESSDAFDKEIERVGIEEVSEEFIESLDFELVEMVATMNAYPPETLPYTWGIQRYEPNFEELNANDWTAFDTFFHGEEEEQGQE